MFELLASICHVPVAGSIWPTQLPEPANAHGSKSLKSQLFVARPLPEPFGIAFAPVWVTTVRVSIRSRHKGRNYADVKRGNQYLFGGISGFLPVHAEISGGHNHRSQGA